MSITDVNLIAMTCTCTVHGEDSRLRVRHRAEAARPELSCRICNRGPNRGTRSWSGMSPALRRAATLREKYGITVSDYDQMLLEQAGRCAICATQLIDPCVDHDHATGTVRGLLCRLCNLGLGYLQDDPALMSAAIAYLNDKKPPPTP